MPIILIIEDEPTIAEMLQEVLQDEGYVVLLALNGETGLQTLATQQPDLILCDLMMPIMSGWQVLEALQEPPYSGSIPVIMMSAGQHPAPTYAGMYRAFLEKPINLYSLLKLIEELLTPSG